LAPIVTEEAVFAKADIALMFALERKLRCHYMFLEDFRRQVLLKDVPMESGIQSPDSGSPSPPWQIAEC
jgi:hypothetical protein